MKKRVLIRKKMGKRVFFTLTHCSKKLEGISNKYNYKANIHNLCFVGASFYNVKYQSSIMTNCNYRDSNILGVDYFNCNMRSSSFKNVRMTNVVFYNCNLKGVDFSNAIFKNVTFICTNLNETKNLNIYDKEIRILHTYNPIKLDESIEKRLLDLAHNKSIYEARVLHVNKNKLNHWNLGLICQDYGIEAIDLLSVILNKKEDWNNMYTVFSYMLLIEKWKGK